MKVVLIGAGNVATHLGLALKSKGYRIEQVYSRTEDAARLLGNRLESNFTADIRSIITGADIYFIAVKDSVVEEILSSMPAGNGLYVHTAGSIPMDIFSGYIKRYGVFYPLQTFSKNREISFDHIPLLLESTNPSDGEILHEIAGKLSDSVYFTSYEDRKYIHLAAVFACNFTNHMYTLAACILENKQLNWRILLPLIEETAGKTKTIHPQKAQTGPAVRIDTEVMEEHMKLLDEHKKNLYRNISKSIQSIVS